MTRKIRGSAKTVEPGGHHRHTLAEIEHRQDQQQVEAEEAHRLTGINSRNPAPSTPKMSHSGKAQ